ncbi:MAG: hypothetical protein HY459_03275 [Parcubacteria group bacterium]|nr:hypothetical protein [Parcubacteria group bacterium]
MYWANFLHIYQPPTQSREILRKIVHESYRPVLRILKKYPNARLTLNISGSLTELLATHGFQHVLRDIEGVLKTGRVELTETAKYHPILPLLPREEIVHQIEENHTTNRRHFGALYKPEGFFLPEMAFSMPVARAVAELGYRWIIVDEIAKRETSGPVRYDRLYKIADLNLFVFFASRKFSRFLTSPGFLRSKDFVKVAKAFAKEYTEVRPYLVTATDGEAYGHHFPHRESLLDTFFRQDAKSEAIDAVTVSELFDRFTTIETVSLVPSTWETTEADLARKAPYPLWNDPQNGIHAALNELMALAINVVNEHKEDSHYAYARTYLDRGLHSCSLWSASPWWNPDMVIAGATEVIRAVRSLENLDPKTRLDAEELFLKVQERAWRKHWTGEAQREIDSYFAKRKELESKL